MDGQPVSRRRLAVIVLSRFVLFLLLLMLVLFLPAGTLAYWQAGAYLGMLFIPMSFVGVYLFVRDPALLERRMQLRERSAGQRRLIQWSWLYFLVLYIFPGLDHRFGWSQVPWFVVVLTDVVVFLSYGMVAWVFRTNSYASRVVEVQAGQQVINTGPYAIVRHPMYLASIFLWGLTPLALGSAWGLILSVLMPLLMVVRIRDEERLLLRDLPGYREYTAKVRYRLFPGIW